MNNPSYEIVQFGLFDSTFKFPDTTVTNDRLLDSFELELYTSDCPGITYINGNAYPLKEGLLICGKPGQMRHSRLPFKCGYLHIKTKDAELSSRLYKLKDTDYPPDFDELTKLFYKIAAHDAEDISDSLWIRSCTDRILYLLLRTPEKQNTAKRLSHAREMAEIKDYIKYRYYEKLSLELLASRVGLSPIYFHKLFRESYGITPADYIKHVRISAAKQMLITSEKTIAEIAAACGFSSQSYFNCAFKEQSGMSPLKYKKETVCRMQI